MLVQGRLDYIYGYLGIIYCVMSNCHNLHFEMLCNDANIALQIICLNS